MIASNTHSASQLEYAADAELMRSIVAGDDGAFRTLFERHAPVVRGFLRLRVDVDSADDLTVTTFATAWEQRARYRADADTARPWLLGIAANLALRQHEAERRRLAGERAVGLSTSRDGVSADPDPTDPIDLRLAAAIRSLSPRECNVFLLTALGELTIADAARALGITAVAARVRLHRARTQLRALLKTEES